jgi:nucleoside-diphosphate-sugar epimerase
MQSQPLVTGPVNLGNPDPITMLDLAEEIIGLCNSESKVAFEPLPSDDPTNRLPDISVARDTLNWSPVVSRREGLESTVRYFQSIL